MFFEFRLRLWIVCRNYAAALFFIYLFLVIPAFFGITGSQPEFLGALLSRTIIVLLLVSTLAFPNDKLNN